MSKTNNPGMFAQRYGSAHIVEPIFGITPEKAQEMFKEYEHLYHKDIEFIIMSSDNKDTVEYRFTIPSHAQNELLKLVVSTFKNHSRNSKLSRFPKGNINCSLHVSDTSVILITQAHAFKGEPDTELVYWRDIPTIPLMQPALLEAKRYASENHSN